MENGRSAYKQSNIFIIIIIIIMRSYDLTCGDTNEYVMRPFDPESASVAVAVKMLVPTGWD